MSVRPMADGVSIRRGKPCWHRQSTVCSEERTVQCAACGALLDPITVLRRLAAAGERRAFEARFLAEEIAKLRERLAELKREERNVKGRLRRARGPKSSPAEASRTVMPRSGADVVVAAGPRGGRAS